MLNLLYKYQLDGIAYLVIHRWFHEYKFAIIPVCYDVCGDGGCNTIRGHVNKKMYFWGVGMSTREEKSTFL